MYLKSEFLFILMTGECIVQMHLRFRV